MRLHSLAVTAFGPFGGTVTVDFDELGADGLFLLHGQTGAGKTSILDAIAFALYGVVPGARRDTKRLLSDHAAPGVPPSVELVATLGGRRLKLVRSPEYARPKLRGEGTTKQNAKATLTWLDGRGENLTRIDEIAAEVERLLGMRVDQFFQVVLLPQGDFARFLRAKNDERGLLLERLFDTDRFSDIEEWFAERRRVSAEALADRTQSADRIAAQVASAAGVELCTDPEVLPWATALVESARSEAEVDGIRLEAARAEHTAAVDAVRAARSATEARARGAAARHRLAALEETTDARAAEVRELTRATAAAPVERRRHELDDARRRSDAADAVVQARSADAAHTVAADVAASLSWPPAPDDTAMVDAAVQRWSGECAVLDGIAADESARDDLVADRRRRADIVASIDTDVAALTQRGSTLPDAMVDLDREYTLCVQAQASLDALTTRHAAAADAVAAAIEHRRATAAAEAAEKKVLAATAKHQELRELFLELREQRLEGMSAELATRLRDGEPCEVCGAVEHPAPARSSGESVTRDDEDQARHAVDVAGARRDAVQEELHARRREMDVLAARGGTRPAGELSAALDTATAELDAATARAGRAEDVARRRAATQAEAENLRTRISERVAELESHRAHLESLDVRIAETTARIDGAVGALGSARARRAELDGAIAAVVSLRDARHAAADARRTVTELEQRLEQESTDAGFVDPVDARSAVREPRRIAALEQRRTDAESERAAAAAVLAEPTVVAALAGPEVDVDPLVRTERELREVMEEALTRKHSADERRVKVETLVTQLWAAAERLEPVRAAHAELQQLADVVNGRGQNSRKMSLRSYVLAARLEEVAVAASVRFGRMTGGRYEFVHSDEAGPRGTRGGLGLDIRDDYTGVVRAAGTLSGGESFCASLALALGLADVVAAESGGVTLDTMFIDEGFGTLDAESLDSVMGVLDELRSGGRTVGIVSHVDEIRDRVPSRLHVIRQRHGSTVRVHAGV